MKCFSILGLVAALASSGALADCPTSADLDGAGVRLSVAGGAQETLRRRSDGLIESVLFVGEKEVHAVWARGLYLVEMRDMAPDGSVAAAVAFEFPTPLSNLPAPFADGAFAAQAVGRIEGGSFDEAQQYLFGAPGVLTIGDCSFDEIQVRVSFDGSTSFDVFRYIPAFDMAYIDRSLQDGGLENVQAYSQIEVVK